MDALTIHEAAETTGWSSRMLRYIERIGLVEAAALGLRLPPLRRRPSCSACAPCASCSTEYEIGLGDVGFALRLRSDAELRAAVEAWFEAEPERPEEVPASDWLRWEQDKHEKLLAAAAQTLPKEETA